MTLKNLEWSEDEYGGWRARSSIHDDGDAFTWLIRPPRGPRVWFQLDGSPELVGAAATTKFETLERAKAEAQSVEDNLRRDLEKQRANGFMDDDDNFDEDEDFDDEEDDL